MNKKIIKNPKDFPKTLDISNSNCFEFVSKIYQLSEYPQSAYKIMITIMSLQMV